MCKVCTVLIWLTNGLVSMNVHLRSIPVLEDPASDSSEDERPNRNTSELPHVLPAVGSTLDAAIVTP